MQSKSITWLAVSVAVACAARASPEAAAASVTYGFMNITNNHPVNAATEGQFSLTVFESGIPNVLGMTFANSGPAPSSITGVYIHHQTPFFAGLTEIVTASGVSFVAGGSPPSLPGGASFGFPTGQPGTTWRFRSTPPVAPNGVHPSEFVEFKFELAGGYSFADVIDAIDLGIQNPFAAGAMLIGIHVQAFANGGSESFVVIPLPASLWIGMAGLGLVAFGVGRRRLT